MSGSVIIIPVNSTPSPAKAHLITMSRGGRTMRIEIIGTPDTTAQEFMIDATASLYEGAVIQVQQDDDIEASNWWTLLAVPVIGLLVWFVVGPIGGILAAVVADLDYDTQWRWMTLMGKICIYSTAAAFVLSFLVLMTNALGKKVR